MEKALQAPGTTRNKEVDMNKKSILVLSDMDGCAAIFDRHASIEETYEPGYFINRDADWDYLKFLELLKQADVNVVFCSAAYGESQGKEKRQWLDNCGFEDNELIVVPYGVNKREWFIKNHPEAVADINILIDDFTRNLIGWEIDTLSGMPKFIGVKYLNGINDTNHTWRGFRIGMSDPEVLASELLGIINVLQDTATVA